MKKWSLIINAGAILGMLLISSAVAAQVVVREEPFHQKVLENKYIRLLDVWIKPGDTSLFHIHSTPSLFLHFTSTVICIQIKGAAWLKDKNREGNASYRSFVNDTLVHRVSNCDTIPFHVTDIEIISPYNPTSRLKPLPFTVLFENEKSVAYRLSHSLFNNQVSSGRGPMLAELVSGDDVIYNDALNERSTRIKTEKFLYIEPGSSFYFSGIKDRETNLVLFEIK